MNPRAAVEESLPSIPTYPKTVRPATATAVTTVPRVLNAPEACRTAKAVNGVACHRVKPTAKASIPPSNHHRTPGSRSSRGGIAPER